VQKFVLGGVIINSNNIIIAGVPRAGKSTLSNMLSRKIGYQHVSMDAIISGMEAVFPEVDMKWWPSSNDVSENMKRFYNASEKIALFIAAILKSEEYDEFEPGMVIDVYQLLPEHYVKYISGKNIDIAYLLTSDVTVEERIAIHREYDTQKHYTFDFADDDMLSHCAFVIQRSQFLREQCIKYGLPFYETAKNRAVIFEQFIHLYEVNAGLRKTAELFPPFTAHGIRVANVRKYPEYKNRAIEYFQKHWASKDSLMVYDDCITHSISAKGPLPIWYLLLDDDKIIGCAGLITNDFISRMDLMPWLCALYVEEAYRGQNLGKMLIDCIKQDAAAAGMERLYLCTGHVGYYEKYGFEYIGDGYHPWGEQSRIYEYVLD